MLNNNISIEELIGVCKQVRKDILTMLTEAGSGHTGGSLSCVEIMVSLFYKVLNRDPENPDWKERDRFVLSKGHGCPTLYSVMANQGYFPREELMTLRKFGTKLQGHPHKQRLPGLDNSSGSLGQGLSIANGMALGLRLDKIDSKVFCLMGDGELDEGQVWEAAMSSAHYKLNNLCAVIDRNGLQIDGHTEEIMSIDPVDEKFKAFNWHVEVVDGHDLQALLDVFSMVGKIDKPLCVVADTTKGKGISFVENQVGWHGVAPKKDELEKALEELKNS